MTGRIDNKCLLIKRIMRTTAFRESRDELLTYGGEETGIPDIDLPHTLDDCTNVPCSLILGCCRILSGCHILSSGIWYIW
jgi:hypothetical protein